MMGVLPNARGRRGISLKAQAMNAQIRSIIRKGYEVDEEEFPESTMTDQYPAEYWEAGQGSNYVGYGDDPGWGHINAVLQSWLERDSEILELGCAKGYYIRSAVLHGFDAYGVDISAYAIENCHPMVKDRVQLGNAYDLDMVEDESFDAVLSFEMLEHVPEDEIDAVLGEMWGCLMPDGIFLHKIALRDSDHEHGADNDSTHVSIFPAEWWREKFEGMALEPLPELEAELNARFKGRDWEGRFFAYAKPH